MASQAGGSFVHDAVRRATDSAFKAHQRNRMEVIHLKMREEKLDREKVKTRYLAGKRKRLVESGITQLFITSGHSPAALPPEGPHDTEYEKSPYFSKGTHTKIDEKRLLKWRGRERQYERTKKDEDEDLSPWTRAEKAEENQRIMNQLSWIIDNSHKGLELYSKDNNSNEAGEESHADEEKGIDDLPSKNIETIVKQRNVKGVVDVFEKLKLDLEKKNEGNIIPNYIGMKKQENRFSIKEWEKYTTKDYASFITRPVKSTDAMARSKYKTQHHIDDSANVSRRNPIRPQSCPEISKPQQTTMATSINQREKSKQTDHNNDDQKDSETINTGTLFSHGDMKHAKKKIRPISAHSSRSFIKNHTAKRKRIKSAEIMKSNSYETEATSNLEVVKENVLEEGQKNEETNLVVSVKIPGEFDDLEIEKLNLEDLDFPDGSLQDPFEIDNSTNNLELEQQSKDFDPLIVKSTNNTNETNSTVSDTPPSPNPQTTNYRNRSSKPKRKSKTKQVKITHSKDSKKTEQQKTVKKKKKFVTKIKELAELYEDDLSASDDEDELEREANGLNERMSQWRRDLMKEAPPGIYSVNAPVKIHLAVSKSQLQKDLGRLVDENSSDLRHLNDKEHTRRLQSRMNVYTTMKIVEKAVNNTKK